MEHVWVQVTSPALVAFPPPSRPVATPNKGYPSPHPCVQSTGWCLLTLISILFLCCSSHPNDENGLRTSFDSSLHLDAQRVAVGEKISSTTFGQMIIPIPGQHGHRGSNSLPPDWATASQPEADPVLIEDGTARAARGSKYSQAKGSHHSSCLHSAPCPSGIPCLV